MTGKIDAKSLSGTGDSLEDRLPGRCPGAGTADAPGFGNSQFCQGFYKECSSQWRTETVGCADEQDGWHSRPSELAVSNRPLAKVACRSGSLRSVPAGD